VSICVCQHSGPVVESSWRHRRLRSELKALRADPLEGIQAMPLDRHCSHWQACITGPRGSPYEGGLFFLYLQIPHRWIYSLAAGIELLQHLIRSICHLMTQNSVKTDFFGIASALVKWSLASSSRIWNFCM